MKDDDFSYESGDDCCSPGTSRQGRMTMGRDGKVQLPPKPALSPAAILNIKFRCRSGRRFGAASCG